MDCRRRLRLASVAALLVAAILPREPMLRAEEPVRPQMFQSQHQVAPLQCPSQAASSTTKPSSPVDRIPDAEDLKTEAIDPPSPSVLSRIQQLPSELTRGFALPSPGTKPLRVGVWGDSHLAAGFITDELAKHIEARGLTVETRMIPASVGRPGVRLPLRKVCKGGWQFQPGYNADAMLKVGPSLSNLRSSRVGDYLWLDLRQRADHHVSGLQIQYLPTRGRAAIGVRVDDGPEARFETGKPVDHDPVVPGVIDVRASSSISTLKLRVLQGDVVLQGLRLNYQEDATVAIDVFGIPSATVKAWANADANYLKASIPAGGYDAIILEYGTNEGAVGRFDPSAYASMLAASLRAVRKVLPESACVLIGPTDRGVRIPSGKRGSVDFLQYARVHQQITRIQAQIGASYSCTSWDWQRYMGGVGSMYAWARDTPALAAPDLIHLTPLGYRRTAAALAQSIGWMAPAPER